MKGGIESAGLPAYLIGRCCSCFYSLLVLVPLFSCCGSCAFLLRLNQVHPSPLPPFPCPTTTTSTSSTATTTATTATAVSSAIATTASSNTTTTTTTTTTTYSRLQVLVTGHTHSIKLIDQYSFGMRSTSCSSRHLLLKLLLIYGSVFVSSSSSSSSSSYFLLFCFSLRLPPSVRINFPCGNLSPLPPCLLPCSGLLSSQRLIHSTWRYFAGGVTKVYDQ